MASFLKKLVFIGALLAPTSVFAQCIVVNPTEAQVLNTIASCLPTTNANQISALALRQTLDTMTSAIFNANAGGVIISGIPQIGWVPIATSSSTAVWSNLLNVSNTWIALQTFNNISVPTQIVSDNSTNAASTAFVHSVATVGSIISNSTACVSCSASGIIYSDGVVLISSNNLTLNGLIGLKLSGNNFITFPSTDLIVGGTIAIGNGALANQPASALYNNIAIGYHTLSSPSLSTSATSNLAIGSNALAANTNGANNIAIGLQTLLVNTTGGSNVAIGVSALASNTTASQNVVIGGSAGGGLTTGSQNVAIGSGALQFNTSGGLNVAIGISAMSGTSDTGSLNIAIGNSNLSNNTTGIENTAVGSAVMVANTTGNFNTALGVGAMTDNTTGGSNVAVGTNAMFQNTTGSGNTGVGGNTLAANTTGTGGAAFGDGALTASTGNANSGIGTQSLGDVTSGGGNTALGFNTGRGITTGSFNLILGYNVTGLSTTLSNAVILAAGSLGNIRADYNVTTASTWTLTAPLNVTGKIAASTTIQTALIYSAAGTALPTCNGAAEGTRAAVSDATAPTYAANYASGGAVHVGVYCNGTNWITI